MSRLVTEWAVLASGLFAVSVGIAWLASRLRRKKPKRGGPMWTIDLNYDPCAECYPDGGRPEPFLAPAIEATAKAWAEKPTGPE